MLRSAELSKPETEVTLLFFEPETSLARLLGDLEAQIHELSDSPPQQAQHIYIELPSALLFEDVELEEWLQARPDWHSSFVGLISEEAHLLNPHYRELYEEFSRASQSAVVLGRSQDMREKTPAWIERRLFDFGKHVDVFEDDLWPRALFSAVAEISVGTQGLLSELPEEYEELQVPIVFQDTQKMEMLLRPMLQGDFGHLWGAEVIRPLGPSQPTGREVMGLSLSPRAVYEWRAKIRARCLGLSDQISVLSVAGVGLEKNNLIQSLRALQLLADS
jgi:hypothetical protein